MRKVNVSLSVLPFAALVTLAACTVVDAGGSDADDGGTGGASGSSAGSGGSGGSDRDGGPGGAAGGGAAGDAGGSDGDAGGGGADAGDDPCDGVPTTGICEDDTHIRSCLAPEGLDATSKLTTCPDGTACALVNGTAQCQATGECLAGAVECKSEALLRTCRDGAWVETACSGAERCLAQPGVKPSCSTPAQSGAAHVTGNVTYQFRSPKSDLTGFGAPESEPAQALFVAAYDGVNLVGTGTTDAGGTFDVPLTQPTTSSTVLYFFPLMFDESSTPLLAVAKATTSDSAAQAATAYWSWGVDGLEDGQEDVGTLLIDEAAGSGAIYIYEWLAYGMQRNAALLPDGKPLSLLTLWNSGNAFDCGSCFYGPNFGGGEVAYGGGESDRYATTISVSGTSDSPEHWSASAINHEFGHYTMQTYSLSPGEGGKHLVGSVYSPGLAYSEGWATFAGQAQLSGSTPNPVYFNQQKGTAYWADINKLEYGQGALPKPDPTGGIDQPMNEMVVAGAMWALWGDASLGAKYQGLGDAGMFATLTSERLRSSAKNRGYKRVDLVDFLDAVTCSGAGTSANVAAAATAIGFPYDAENATCE